MDQLRTSMVTSWDIIFHCMFLCMFVHVHTSRTYVEYLGINVRCNLFGELPAAAGKFACWGNHILELSLRIRCAFEMSVLIDIHAFIY